MTLISSTSVDITSPFVSNTCLSSQSHLNNGIFTSSVRPQSCTVTHTCNEQLFYRGYSCSSSWTERSTNATSLFDTDFYHIPYTEGVPVGSKLKIFNLPHGCDEDAVIEHFATCGAVVKNIMIVNNPQEGNASGYVVLEDLSHACAAVAQLDGMTFQGKCVRMDFVKRQALQKKKPCFWKQKTKLYIGNLPWRVDDATLAMLFSAHGTVKEAQVVRDRINGRSRGYGFVSMQTSAEVQRAIAMLDGCEIEGRPLKVSVATS